MRCLCLSAQSSGYVLDDRDRNLLRREMSRDAVFFFKIPLLTDLAIFDAVSGNIFLASSNFFSATNLSNVFLSVFNSVFVAMFFVWRLADFRNSL